MAPGRVADTQIDERLWGADATPRKAQVGGNAILACSLAAFRAGVSVVQCSPLAHACGVFRLPRPTAMPAAIVPLVAFARSGTCFFRQWYDCIYIYIYI